MPVSPSRADGFIEKLSWVGESGGYASLLSRTPKAGTPLKT